MKIKIKIINSNKNQWVGWFGDNLIKLKLNTQSNNMQQDLIQFLENDLGIKQQNLISIKQIQQNLFELELPDIAWELFISVID